MNRSLPGARLVAAALLSGLSATSAVAQRVAEWDPNRVQMTRVALEDLRQRLEAAVQSSAYSGAIRDHARLEAATVRTRLEEGDFQVGDRIYLQVDGERQLTDTFTVGPSKVLTLPIVGVVPLNGVLHAELESHLQQSISRYIKDPIVHARTLIRIAILGEVGRPGFYTLPTETLVSDALMLAGGPSHDAKLEKLRIDRGGEHVWEGQALREAVASGKTLDALSLQAGDRIEVPTKGSWFTESTFRAVTLLLTIPVAIYGVTRLF